MTTLPTQHRKDCSLIRACISGDHAAWKTLVERYQKLVYSIPRQLGLAEADGEDVFQAVFLILYRSLASLRDQSRLSAWLITTTRRECYRLIRQRRNGEYPIDLFATQGGETVDDQTDRWERQQLVRDAMARLDERDRSLLSMLFLDSGSPSYETIAEELGMRIGSIGPTRGRALARLQQVLEELGWDGAATEERLAATAAA